jgi:hypothetical protein
MNSIVRWKQMNKLIKPSIALLLVLSLAACQGAPGAATAVPANNSALPANYDNAPPSLTQLLVGTFRLEGQPQAITAEQADELALLWRGYRALSQSDATSQQELASLQAQLEAAMTSEQLAAIQAMRLTAEDLTALMADQGVQLGADRGEMTDEQRARIEALRQAGAAQGGALAGGSQGGPGGGGGGGGAFIAQGGGIPAGAMPPDMAAGGARPDQATGAQVGVTARGGLMVPSGLLDKLIGLLESK